MISIIPIYRALFPASSVPTSQLSILPLSRLALLSLTHFSVVSLKFFSATSNSSSNKEILRVKESAVLFELSSSSLFILWSLNLPSAFSRSDSTKDSLCWREAISCSLVRFSCSSLLFFDSASSARSIAVSASTRRAVSFWGERVVSRRSRKA